MTSATNIPVHVKKNRTAGDWAILILLIVGGLVMLFPFIVLLLNAFKTTADYNSSGPLSWPKEFSTVGLMKFWNRVNYPEKLWNSIWTSGLVAILAVVLSMFNAFALGIGRVKGRRWTIFRKIVFPISKPTLSVMLVFFFIWTWNEYMIPMAFLIDNSTQTIPIAVSSLTGDRLMDVTTTAAASLISIVPTLIFYLIFQRTLSRGITAGAVK